MYTRSNGLSPEDAVSQAMWQAQLLFLASSWPITSQRERSESGGRERAQDRHNAAMGARQAPHGREQSIHPPALHQGLFLAGYPLNNSLGLVVHLVSNRPDREYWCCGGVGGWEWVVGSS